MDRHKDRRLGLDDKGKELVHPVKNYVVSTQVEHARFWDAMKTQSLVWPSKMGRIKGMEKISTQSEKQKPAQVQEAYRTPNRQSQKRNSQSRLYKGHGNELFILKRYALLLSLIWVYRTNLHFWHETKLLMPYDLNVLFNSICALLRIFTFMFIRKKMVGIFFLWLCLYRVLYWVL